MQLPRNARLRLPGLAARDTFIHQYFDLNPSVLRPASLRLVRCRWPILTHCAWCDDMPDRYGTLLDEVGNDGFGAVLAELGIHFSAASRVGVPHHLDDVSFQTSRVLRQLLELVLIGRRDFGAADCEFNRGFALHVKIGQRSETLFVLLDVFDVLVNLLLICCDVLLVGLNGLLLSREFRLVGCNALTISVRTDRGAVYFAISTN